jgi:hypothetical protein
MKIKALTLLFFSVSSHVSTAASLRSGNMHSDATQDPSKEDVLDMALEDLEEIEEMLHLHKREQQGQESHSLDVEERAIYGWNDCQSLAPFIITNIPTRQRRGGEYFFLWDGDKTPHQEWKILSNLEFDGNPWRPWKKDFVWAEEITPAEAIAQLSQKIVQQQRKKVLFYIHGFNADVTDAWCQPNKIYEQSEKYVVIPIIWKTDRGLMNKLDYRYDRIETAPVAGSTLEDLFDSFFAKISQPKSWLCHSMGCHVTQFFATDLSERGAFTDNTKFDDLFLVAPDLRYDFFNEWPYNSGKDKNECYDTEWNDRDDTKRIPDCRLGGGDAFVDMVNNKVHVHWNHEDHAGYSKESRLKADIFHNWPISYKGLSNYGNDATLGGRTPLAKFSGKVKFTQHTKVGSKHGYQLEPNMVKYYEKYGD